jgi:HEAT repeat protein
MFFDYDLMRSIGLFLAGLFGAGIVLRLFLEWRHAVALGQARQIAARLRQPATTLGAVEDRSSAVEELVEFRDLRAAVRAARELLSVQDSTVRSAAIEVLRETRALDLWSRQLRRGSYRAKLRAIEAFGEVGDERAIDELLEALGDDDPDAARAASQAISARDPDYACDRLADALASPNRRLAETAAATLVHMGEDALDALVGQLGSASAQARRLAVESLGGIGEENLRGALLPLLDADPDAGVRVAAANALARIDPTSAADHLQRIARSDPDWFVRARAHSLLAETATPGAAEFLMESLALLGPGQACFEDAEDLESITEGPRRVVSAILSGLRLLGFTEDEVASAEARARGPALAGDEEAEVVEALSLLRDRDPVRRAEAARRLGDAPNGPIDVLRQALQDPNPLVRSEAARSLGRSASRSSLGDLARCLQDPDEDVRLAASAAMRAVVTREVAQELQD